MAEEMRLHVEHLTQKSIADGLSPEEACFAAQRRFGGAEQFKEQCRDGMRWSRLEDLLRDVRHAVRRLAKSPGFTFVAVVMLGLGIGMSTAAFSITNSVLLRSADYPNSDQLVRIFRTSPQSQTNWNSPANFFYLRSAATSFSEIAEFTPHSSNIAEKGEPPEEQFGLVVTANFLTTIGVQPLLGRGFAPDEDQPGKSAVVLLTNTYWKHRFGGDPKVIGRTLRVGVDNLTVIGILPDFDPTNQSWRGADFVMPVTLWPNFPTLRDAKWFDIIARLKPGVSMGAAQAELSTLAARIDHDYPADNGLDGFRVTHLTGSDADGNTQTLHWLRVGLAVLVLLIACANLASLQLARAIGRYSEFAVRSALGASRFDLVMPLLVESLVLTLAGGVVGLMLGHWTNHLISHYLWGGFPIPLDARVLSFAFLASLATGLTFGLAPAWMTWRIPTGAALNQISRGSTATRSQHRFKFLLVVGQLALALVLVSAALSFGIAIRQSLKRNLGWQPEGLFSGFISVNRDVYKPDAKKTEFLNELRSKLGQIPGVTAVSITSGEPLVGYFDQQRVVVEGSPPVLPGREQPAQAIAVDPRYFPILGIPLRAGRQFPSNVKAGDPGVIVINETMARQYWSVQDAIGKRVRFADQDGWNEVIGVVGDVHMAAGFDSPYSRIQIYRALEQAPHIHYTFILSSAMPPEALVTSARRALGEIDPDLMLQEAGSVDARMHAAVSEYNLMLFSMGAFAFVGLLIALIGLYAVITQVTMQRHREFGIRIALGASYPAMLGLVLSHGARLVFFGTILGVLGSAGINMVYRHAMPELQLPGVAAELMITSLLCLAALVACFLPARRAGQIDPVIALKAE